MDIETLKSIGQKLWSIPRQTGAAIPPGKENLFEETLQALSQQPKLSVPQARQTAALAELAQLQLLQGLFAVEDEAADEGFLSTLNVFRVPVAATPEPQQQTEALYQRIQPSLLASEPANHSEIEGMIEQVAERVSLAPALIRSVVTAESAYQPDAVSAAGAQGLMQLMPETAQELGVDDSFDPLQNLLGGSRYLKQLLDKYEGDLDKALAAYNWGQGNVDRKGLAQMPQETRDYLTKVKGLLATQA